MGLNILLPQTADYSFTKNNPNWDLVLDIKIDIGGGEEVNILYFTSKKKIKDLSLILLTLYYRVKRSNVLPGASGSHTAKKRS